jgi:multicomponent Na+:H+ antiporter subunit B
MSELKASLLSSFGILIYSGIGLLCLILGGNFLDYGRLSVILKVIPAQARSLGILGVEIGVGITVMAVMFSIFFDISTGGIIPEDEGD